MTDQAPVGPEASSLLIRESRPGVWVGALAGLQAHRLASTQSSPHLHLHMCIFLHRWKTVWYAAYDNLMKSRGMYGSSLFLYVKNHQEQQQQHTFLIRNIIRFLILDMFGHFPLCFFFTIRTQLCSQDEAVTVVPSFKSKLTCPVSITEQFIKNPPSHGYTGNSSPLSSIVT